MTGTLYEGLGYDIEEVSPGLLAPVGYVNPNVAYTLPSSSTGGRAAGNGAGLGAAQLSTGTSLVGQRGLVITSGGSYALGTLGANSVAGWTPVGMASSSAQGIAASGLIVGTSELYSADGTQNRGGRAVYYAPGSTLAQQLALPTGFTDSTGFGIGGSSTVSSTGVVIGFATQYNGDASLGTRAMRWKSAGAAPEVLGKLPGYSQFGDSSSFAVAVNAPGTAVGWGNTFGPQGRLLGSSAIRWDAGTTQATALGHLGTSAQHDYSSRASAVNDGGTVVGYSAKYSASHRSQGEVAVRWAPGSTAPTELHAFGPNAAGESYSYALAVNDAGTVAGNAEKFGAAGEALGTRAVRWDAGSTQAGELTLLSEGADGASFSYAFGINASGYVVGFANITGTQSSGFFDPAHLDVHATVWTPTGEVIDLNSLLPADSPWKLYTAYAISDSGWITGLGYYQPAGYSADYTYSRLYSMQLAVPEPAPAALMALGLGALGLWRRRRA